MNNDQLIQILQAHKSDTRVIIRYPMGVFLMRVDIEDAFLDGDVIILEAGEHEDA